MAVNELSSSGLIASSLRLKLELDKASEPSSSRVLKSSELEVVSSSELEVVSSLTHLWFEPILSRAYNELITNNLRALRFISFINIRVSESHSYFSALLFLT
jgi:hypothetical protein